MKKNIRNIWICLFIVLVELYIMYVDSYVLLNIINPIILAIVILIFNYFICKNTSEKNGHIIKKVIILLFIVVTLFRIVLGIYKYNTYNNKLNDIKELHEIVLNSKSYKEVISKITFIDKEMLNNDTSLLENYSNDLNKYSYNFLIDCNSYFIFDANELFIMANYYQPIDILKGCSTGAIKNSYSDAEDIINMHQESIEKYLNRLITYYIVITIILFLYEGINIAIFFKIKKEDS